MKKLLLVLFFFIFAVFICAAKPSVLLVTDARGIEDRSVNEAVWRGILFYYGDTWEKQTNRGKLYDTVACNTNEECSAALKKNTPEKFSLICIATPAFASALQQVVPLYPNQKFMIIDSGAVRSPNVAGYVFKEEQGAYVAGVLAALQAKSDGVADPGFGYVNNFAGSVSIRYKAGFFQGVRSVLPEARVFEYHIVGADSYNVIKAQVKSWYDSGAYAVMSYAGLFDGAVIEQAKEYRLQNKNVWVLGIGRDRYAEGIYAGKDAKLFQKFDGDAVYFNSAKFGGETKSAVLTSVIKRVESTVMDALGKIESGNFTGGLTVFDMSGGSIDFTTTNPALNKDVVARVIAVKDAIITGEIKVHELYGF